MTRRTLTITLTLSAVLRLLSIWNAPLWYDENFTRAMMVLPFGRMLQAVAWDVHPPLWYLLEWPLFHWWNAPGWALRLPAALFGVLAVWLYQLVLARLSLPRAVYAGALGMMAVLPFQLWFSMEARMYTLLECLVLAALLTVLDRRWLRFGLLALAMAYLQNFGPIYAAALAAVAVLRRRADWKPVAVCGAGVLAGWAPWAIIMLRQMQAIHGNYWIMPVHPGQAFYIVFQNFWANGLPDSGLVTGMLVTFAAIIWGTWDQARASDGSGRVVLTMGLLPMAISYLVSVLYQPILLWRAFIASAPFWYILAARPLAHVRNLRHGLLAAIFILPLLLSSTGIYYSTSTADKGNSRRMVTALAYIRAHWREGDAIYVTDDGPMLAWYVDAADMPMLRIPQCQPPRGALTEQTRQALGVPALPPGDVSARRLWVAAPVSPLHPGCYIDQVETLLAAEQCTLAYQVDYNEWIESAVYLCEDR